MGELRGVLLERRVTVGIAVGVKSEPHFVIGKFLVRMRRRRRLGDWFLRRMRAGPNFSQSGLLRRRLSGRIFFLQRFELTLQLSQRKRQLQLRRDEKRLHKQNGRDENDTIAAMSKERRSRGQRLPAGSEKTNGVIVSRGPGCITRGYCRLDRAEENSGRNEHGLRRLQTLG